jgi:hypothetical protein
VFFRVGGRQFTVETNAAYLILQYKSLPTSLVQKSHGDSLARREDSSEDGNFEVSMVDIELPQPHADVLFQEITGELNGCGEKTFHLRCTYQLLIFPYFTDSHIVPTLTFCEVNHNTNLSSGQVPRCVRIDEILVISEQITDFSNESSVQQIKCDTVEIEFQDSNDAKRFRSSLESMQSHLFHHYLARPLFGEHTIFRRSMGDMILQGHLLPGATMTLIYSPGKDEYRLILLANTRAASICMPLSPNELQGLMTERNTGSKKFSAYFLIRDMNGSNVMKQQLSFMSLCPDNIPCFWSRSGRSLVL